MDCGVLSAKLACSFHPNGWTKKDFYVCRSLLNRIRSCSYKARSSLFSKVEKSWIVGFLTGFLVFCFLPEQSLWVEQSWEDVWVIYSAFYDMRLFRPINLQSAPWYLSISSGLTSLACYRPVFLKSGRPEGEKLWGNGIGGHNLPTPGWNRVNKYWGGQ
jgi:hypothetical protein